MSNCDAAWHRLLADGRVRWMPGMLALCPQWPSLRLCWEVLPHLWAGISGEVVGHDYAHDIRGAGVPDWTDHATLGCLLAMVREATGCHSLYCRESSQGGWVACAREQAGGSAGVWRGQNEVAALLAAIDAAPRKS